MTRVTYKFAKGQYFLSAFLFIWNTVTPFVNLLFPKWILDELSGERSWNRLLLLLILWATVNGIMALIQAIVNIFSNPYLDKNAYKENIHYLKFDAEMDYGKIENGCTLDEQGRIATNLSLASFNTEEFGHPRLAVVYGYNLADIRGLCSTAFSQKDDAAASSFSFNCLRSVFAY